MAGTTNPFDQFDAPQTNAFDQFDALAQDTAGVGRKAADLGLSVAKGIVGVPQAAVGVADLVTGGKAGKALENAGVRFQDAQDILSGWQSPDLKAKQQEFAQADGVLPKLGVALRNPSLIANAVAESAPSMGASGVVARGALPLVARLGAYAPTAAGAIGEGVVGAGQAAEQYRNETPDRELTAKQAGLAAASGLADTVLAGAGGATARRLGIGDVDTMIARGSREVPIATAAKPKGLLRRAGEGFVSEGLLEEAPQSAAEQVLQNVALDRPLGEDVAGQTVMGGLAGGVMGGGAGAVSRPHAAPTPPPGPLQQAAALVATTSPGASAGPSNAAPATPPEAPDLTTSPGATPAYQKVDFQRDVDTSGLSLEDPAAQARARAATVDFQPTDTTPNWETAAGAAPPRQGLEMPPPQFDTGDLGIQREGGPLAVPPGGAPAARGQSGEVARGAGLAEIAAPPALPGPKAIPLTPLNSDVLAEDGQPFRSGVAAARAAKRAGSGFRVVRLSGNQFVVRRDTADAIDVQAREVPTVDDGAHQAAASPRNSLPAPTKGQILAGNAKLGHARIGGLGLSIENPAGSVREDKQNTPPKWRTPMANGYHYGYFKRTEAADSTEAKRQGIDAFVKEGLPQNYAGPVFVVDQVDPKTGRFDEHKVLVGPRNEREAMMVYRKHYQRGWKGGAAVTRMEWPQFKEWVRSGKKELPAVIDPNAPGTTAAAPVPGSSEGQRADAAAAGSGGPAGGAPAAAVAPDASTSRAGDQVAPQTIPRQPGPGGTLQFEPITGGDARSGTYTVAPARYAKGKVGVQAPSSDGFKTRAARLADSIAKGSYSNRERAYIMSPAQAERFLKLHAEDWDASAVTGELQAPDVENSPAELANSSQAGPAPSEAAPAGNGESGGEPAKAAPAASEEFAAAMRDAGLTERVGGADADWRLVVSGLGDVLVKIDGTQDGEPRATITAEYMGKNLGERQAVGLPAVLEAVNTARDGIQKGREKLAAEAVAKERGVPQEKKPKVEGPNFSRSAQTDAQKAAFLQGEPVADLKTQQAPRGFAAIRAWATQLFNDIGGKATNPELGEVVLNHHAVRDSLGHGINPFKAEAFAAVAKVIEKGVVVHTGRKGDQDSFWISAPVRILGKDDIVTVLVRRDANTQRMYLHSVATKEYLLNPRVSRAPAKAGELTGSSSSGDVESVLRKLLAFKLDGGGENTAFRRGAEPALAAMEPTAIQEAVARLTGDWLRRPDIHVLDSMDDAPPRVREIWQRQNSQGGTGAIEGFHYKGGVYLVADALTSEADVRRVLFHEALGHWGLRGVFGDRLKPILQQLATLRPQLIERKAAQYGLNLDNPAERLMAAEEVLAELAQTRPQIGFVQRAIAAIRQWLRGHGVRSAMTDAEVIANYILPARGWVERGRATAPSSVLAPAAFSRQDDEAAFSRAAIVGATRTYTAEQERAMQHVGFQVQQPSLKERAQALWKDAGKKLAQGIVDQFAPVKDLDREAYSLLRLSKGASGAFETLLHGGMLKLTGGVYDFDEAKKGGVVDKLLVPLQGEHHDFFRWVAANRAERLAGEGKENLFTPEDIAALKTLADGQLQFDYTIQNGPRAGQTTRARAEAYADSLKTFNEFNRNVLDLAEQSGLIDGASRHFWEHEFYVPFYRVADDFDGGFRGANIKSGVVRQRAFEQLKGGKEKLNADLLDNTLLNWAHLIDAAAKNRAAKATLEAAEKMGVALNAPEGAAREIGKATGNRNGVVWFMDGGRERYFVVEDPYVLTALTSLEYAGMRNPVMDAMGAFKHALTVGVTASPFFKVRNLIRDSVQAIASGPLSFNPAKNIAEGWKATNPKSDAYFRLLASGGTIHFGTMLEGSEGKRVQSLVEAGVDRATILDTADSVKAFYRRYIEPAITAYNELGNRGEAVNRAALYNQLVAQGVSHAEAALQARDLMDFSMQGSFTSIRFLTQVVPFFNARIQGLYKLGRAAKEEPARIGAVLGAAALVSIALMAGYADDDDWKKREDWDRNNFWWFKFGGVAFRIPKPFEIGAIATLAERGVELMVDNEMTGDRFRRNVLQLLGDNLSMNPIPQLVKPVVDVYANKDSFTGRPIESMGMENLRPEYRFNDRTSMVARGASTALNAAAGAIGAEALSPVQIDHLLRGYFSWLGSFVVGAADTIARPATGQPAQAAPDYWKALTGSMVSDLEGAPSRYVSQMYDQAREIEQAYGTWKMLLKEGKGAEAAQFREAHQEQLAKYHATEKVKRAEGFLNQRIRAIERSDLAPEVKRDRIRQIRDQQDRLARGASPGTAR